MTSEIEFDKELIDFNIVQDSSFQMLYFLYIETIYRPSQNASIL
jgi:hypothetical protein